MEDIKLINEDKYILPFQVFNSDGILIKNFGLKDEVKLNLLSYLASKMHMTTSKIFNDVAKANLELLRIYTKKKEYVIACEKNHIAIAEYYQPNEYEVRETEKKKTVIE